jgi:hypothetical protein
MAVDRSAFAAMGKQRKLIAGGRQAAAPAALAVFFVAITVLTAAAQETTPAPQQDGFLAAAGRWLEEQFGKLGSGFHDARKSVETFGKEAGIAARTTADGAREAADAVVRIPNARSISGHETCYIAPNGAPDCLAAATALCKSKGFDSGKSLDMTTAEVCSPKTYMSGRAVPGDCRTETFVSRALCQ